MLTGQSGLGKTFLLRAMARVLLGRGVNVLLVSAYRFFEIARKAYLGGPAEELASLMETDVLMIDDLGSEPMVRNITIETLFNLINERQNAGRGLVISTNLNQEELCARYTERIASRLLSNPRQSQLLQLLGEDVPEEDEMNIQLYISKKNFDAQKAERFFKEPGACRCRRLI